MDQIALYSVAEPPAGAIRIGVDEEIAAALDAGRTLSPARVALVRAVADELDALRRLLRTDDAAYSRGVLKTLSGELRSLLADLIPPAGSDPFADLLADLASADAPAP